MKTARVNARGLPFFLALFACFVDHFTLAADKSGVSPNNISLPKGPGSIEGLGDSFQPTLNTGTAKYSVALKVPPGTAGQTPSLALVYEGGGGNGILGFGWQLPTTSVQRQTDKGIPTYGVSVGFGREDHFINDMKEELVPRSDGYFFCKNEGAFIRYRFVPLNSQPSTLNSFTGHWEATLADGTRLEFGLDDTARVQEGADHIFSWLLQRETDTRGNTILYSYTNFPGAQNLGQKYLTEIRYGPGTPPWTHFHFVTFVYEDRPDWFEDCRASFPVRTGQRLKSIAIGTQGTILGGHQQGDFNGDGVSDNLVRRYELSYLNYSGTNSHWSLLAGITPVGMDGTNALPSSTFNYAVCNPLAESSAAGREIGAVDEPPFVMDNELVDFADLNGDGLPDMLKTGGPAHEGYLNRGEVTNQQGRAIAWSAPVELASASGDAWLFNLNATATHLADMDGDGHADLTHKAGDGSVFYFANLGTKSWGERQAMSVGFDPPPAPFSEPNVRTADLDFDKRTDLIRGDGLQYQIWFNLGSNQYSERITVPQEFAFDFANPAVQIADLNGDRVPDIARVWPTSVEATMGMGYGRFTAPTNLPIPDFTLDASQISRAKFSDITGDGLADLVVERAEADELWYWINLGNTSFSPRKRITGLPGGLAPQTVVRWADLNGNGSTDLVYADGASVPRLRTIDIGEILNCGATPNVLTAISNGIGRVTLIGYAPSTKFMLDDVAAGQPWTNSMPFPVQVVACVTNLDSLGHSYLTKFRYHDGYYDSVEKQFRGFARVEQIDLGDVSAPTLVTRSHFDTGRTFEVMKGKLLRLTAETETGGVFKDDFTAWQLPPRILMTGTNGQPVHYTHPTGTTNILKELGQGVERRLESEMAFDDFGNQTVDVDYGVVENGNRSAFDDERTSVTEFAINTNAWILRTPKRSEIRDGNGAVISRTDLFYDDETFSGNNWGIVTIGNLTLKRDWISPSNSTATISSARTKYDSYGSPVTILDPLATASGGSVDFSKGHGREIAYDSRFHTYPITETIHLGSGKAPLVFHASYDEGFGTVASSTDFNANTTTYAYDTFARLTGIVKPGDTPAYPTVEYDYALAVPFAATSVVNYVETRQLDKTPGTAGGKRDHYLLSRQFVDGLGRKLITKQEAEHAPGSSTPRVVVTEAVQFNTRQKPVRVLNPFFSLLSGSINDLLSFENIEAPGWQGQFHHEGSLVTLNLATAHASSTVFDAMLRPVQNTNPDGTLRRTVYEPLLTRSFDENDNDPASPYHDTPMVHANDGLGRLIRVEEISRLNDDGTPAGTLKTWTTLYQYDLHDQLTRITDSQNNIKTFAYDGIKRKTAINDPDRGVMHFLYDDASNLTETTDAKSQRITYTYDGANRIRTEKYHDGQPAPGWRSSRGDEALTNSVVYHYDEPLPNLPQGDNTFATAQNVKGALAWVEDLSGDEHTSYDSRGRVDSVVKRIPDPQILSLSALGGEGRGEVTLISYKTAFAYDSLDRLTNLTYPDADQLRYEYNDRNLLQSIPGGPSGSVIANIAYQPSAQMGQIDYGNGVRTTYAYDSRLRLSELFTFHASRFTDLIHFAYDFDGVSNIKSIEDRRPGSAVAAGDPRRNTQLFQYDDLYRLTRVQYSFALPGTASRNDGEINYRYDRIGNMLAQTSTLNHQEKGLPVANLGQMDSGGSAGRWNRTGRGANDEPGPHALTAIRNPQSAIRNFPYDSNGNMTNIDGLVCTWDFKDRLVAVENAEMRAAYSYDYTDRRISKRVDYKPGFTNHVSRITTLYINKYFEVREHDAPTKYVWNGNTRVARVTGSLNTNVRVQRLRVHPGWNLCSLAVSSPSPLWGEGRGEVLSAAFRWNSVTLGWEPVASNASLPAGTVLWLQATTNATLTITGPYTDPTNRTVTAGGDFLPSAGLEALPLLGERAGVRADVSLSMFDSATKHWLSWLPPPLELQFNLPAFIAPGQAMFARADAPLQLEVPDSALRIRYYHQDHIGSSSLIADASGQVVEEVSNYSFGHTRYSVRPSAIREPFGFTQKERDVESGLHYFEARFHAATLARFTRIDPAAREIPSEWLENPQLLNVYAYGGNNPVKYRDPTGKFLETAWDVASFAMGVASIASWDENTSFLEKALDVGGLVVDTAAIVVPFVPGGAGAAIKAGKLATKADDLLDAGKAIKQTLKGDEAYKGVRELSKDLKSAGVGRAERKQIAESFDVRTIQKKSAGPNEMSYRYHDRGLNANDRGRYLSAKPNASRKELAIDRKWNKMSDQKKWKIEEGSTFYEGKVAPQGDLPGGGTQRFVPDPAKQLKEP